MKYKWEVKGSAAAEQNWATSGVIEIDKLGNFPLIIDEIMLETFTNLTQGRCKGPYSIQRMLIEVAE